MSCRIVWYECTSTLCYMDAKMFLSKWGQWRPNPQRAALLQRVSSLWVSVVSLTLPAGSEYFTWGPMTTSILHKHLSCMKQLKNLKMTIICIGLSDLHHGSNMWIFTVSFLVSRFEPKHQLQVKCKQLDKGLKDKLPSRLCHQGDGGPFHTLSSDMPVDSLCPALLCMVS